jgi:hypothetical protein
MWEPPSDWEERPAKRRNDGDVGSRSCSVLPVDRKKYGRSIAQWQEPMAATGITEHMELVGWLKREHGLGHGYANVLTADFLGKGQAVLTALRRQHRGQSASEEFRRVQVTDRSSRRSVNFLVNASALP